MAQPTSAPPVVPAEQAQSLLAERIASVPEVLRQIFHAAPPPELESIVDAPRFVVTGGGFSEGPARVLVALLQRIGRAARYLPLSSFAAPVLPRSDAVLILFSQGLAPNARLPLAHLDAFEKTLVFTSIGITPKAGSPSMLALAQRLAQRGVLFFRHPPLQEGELLVRVVGPTAALACALRFVELLEKSPTDTQKNAQLLQSLSNAKIRAIDLFSDGKRPLAIVAGDELCELAFPLRWKLLEGLRACDPPVWDFLQIIHGPLQAFFDGPITLLSFERQAHPHESEFASRLAALLHPERHRLIRYAIPKSADPSRESTRSLMTDLLHVDAELNAALLATVRAHSINLGDWPLRQRDGALYDIDPTTLKLPAWEA